MSSKLKGGNVAVRVLLGHGEKIWMLGIAVCAALMIWSALGREHLEESNSPDVLQNKIKEANNHMQGFSWDGAPADNKIVASTISSEAMKPIPHEHFPALGQKFDRIVLDPVEQRADPELLAVLDLEAYGDSGILATSTERSRREKKIAAATLAAKQEAERNKNRDNPLFNTPAASRNSLVSGQGGVIIERPAKGNELTGLEDTEAESWVTLVGKIPIKDQYLRYRNVLLNARKYKPKEDVPNYFGYLVLRSEVTSAGEGPWKKIIMQFPNIQKAYKNSADQSANGLLGSEYTHRLLTHPLPMLLLRKWDKRITHSEIPLIADEIAGGVEVAPAIRETETITDDVGFSVNKSTSKTPTSPTNRSNLATKSAKPKRIAPGGNLGRIPDEYVWDGKTQNLLFRYIDRTVTPGRRYRYKIQLALYDVNNNVDDSYLDSKVIERRQALSGKTARLVFRLAPVSEPSPIVSVPLSARVYLAGGSPAKEENYNSEPEALMLVKSYEGKDAAETARMDKVKRGRVINVNGQAAVIWSKDFSPEAKAEFRFNTGITLLDVSGGDALTKSNRSLTVPARAVLMDATGRVFIQSQAEDYEPVAQYREIIGAATKRKRPTAPPPSRSGASRRRR